MLRSVESFYRGAAEHWCHFAHSEPMWPVNGKYRCPTCHRTYPVPWANTPTKPVHRIPVGHATRPKAA